MDSRIHVPNCQKLAGWRSSKLAFKAPMLHNMALLLAGPAPSPGTTFLL